MVKSRRILEATSDGNLEICENTGRTFVHYITLGFNYEDDQQYNCWCSDDPLVASSCQSTQLVNVMRILGIVQSIAAFLVFTFFFIKTAPILWRRAQKRFEDKESGRRKSVVIKVRRFFRTIGKWTYGVYNVFSAFSVFYYFLYTLCAVLGVIFVSSPSTYWLSNFFVMLLLFDLVFRAPLLQHIVSAIWRPRNAIALALVLFLILEYIFTLFAYYYFPADFRGQCNSLRECLLLTIDNTFTANGGVGGYLQGVDGLPDYTSDPVTFQLDTTRFYYDNLFNFLIVILIVQIISGIIIDTFAVLREEDEDRENDMNNSCFICGFDRQTLDKKSDNKKGFAYHVKFDHNLWNYFYYIAYLRYKEKTEYSGMESYISEQLANGEIDWFPIHRTDAIKDTEDDDENDNANAKIALMLENNFISLKEQVEKLDGKTDAVRGFLQKVQLHQK